MMNQEVIRIDLVGVNCYLIKTDKGFILFDTGGHITMDKQFTNRRELLQKELEKAGCTNNNFNLIVLTHGDNDHVCNAAYLRDHYNVKIAMHAGDRELVESPNMEKLMESFHYRSFVYRILFKFLKKVIIKVMQKTLDDFQKFSPDILLTDGYSFSQYGLDAKVIYMPGHTEGSIAILTNSGELIAGDSFSNMKKPDIAPNAKDFKLLSESIHKLKSFKINIVYPGHGDPFYFKDLKY